MAKGTDFSSRCKLHITNCILAWLPSSSMPDWPRVDLHVDRVDIVIIYNIRNLELKYEGMLNDHLPVICLRNTPTVFNLNFELLS